MNVCRVLCVCGSEAVAEKTIRALNLGDPVSSFVGTRVTSVLDGLGELARNHYDVVITEIGQAGATGPDVASEIRRCAPRIPLVVLALAEQRDLAIAAVRDGARDFFIIEDLDSEALRKSVLKASETDQRKPGSEDRRTNARFPCRLAITWRTLEQPIKSGDGASETLNISSKGILFTTDEQFEPGQLLQVSLDWPARLGNEVPLKLVAEGRVLRNADGKTAMSIERYEFRTRRGAAAPPVPPAVNQPRRATGTNA